MLKRPRPSKPAVARTLESDWFGPIHTLLGEPPEERDRFERQVAEARARRNWAEIPGDEPAQRKQKTAPKGENVRDSLKRLFSPDGVAPPQVPPQKDLPNKDLIRLVRDNLKDCPVSFGDDVILREAGRKPKRSRRKTIKA
jgi:hypothetical protein